MKLVNASLPNYAVFLLGQPWYAEFRVNTVGSLLTFSVLLCVSLSPSARVGCRSRVRTFKGHQRTAEEDVGVLCHLHPERRLVRFRHSGRIFANELDSFSAWLQAKDLSLLKTHEIDAFLNDAKKGRADLVEGYKLAKESNAWYESYKKDQSARAEQEKESEDNAEVDQLESEGADEGDDEEEKSKSKTAKKRKRDSDADTIKPKKTAKPKKESNDAPKKKSATNSKSKKSKAVVESEDDAEGETTQAEKEDANGKSKASPPPAKKAKRDKDDDGDDGMSLVATLCAFS